MKWKSGLCLGLLLAALVPWTAAAQTAVGNFKWILIDGTKVSVGSGAPSGGSSGDVYIRTNGTIYTNISGVWTASASGGSGTVRSVGLSVPGLFAVSGTPVTTSGTIAVSLATQSANTVLAGPTSGAAAQPAFRSIVFGDWASNSCASGQIPKYNGSAWACADDAGASSGAPSAAQYVTLATDATLTNERVLTAGTGITVTDGGAGSTLTIAADGAAITSLNASNISSGTLAAARGGAGTVSGLLKANGSGAVSAATSGTDYAPATSGTAVLKGNGSGGFASAASGTDYAPATSGSLPLFGNGSGGFSNGTVQGNTTKVVTYAGSAPATDDCAKFDASGNLTSAGAACGAGGGGGGTVTTTGSPSSGQVAKFSGATSITTAVSGTDYAPATSGSSILAGNGSGGFSAVTVGSGLSYAGGTLSASGGGGTTTYTSAYSSPPGSPASGDLWLPSDGFALYRYSGSAWMPWGAIQPMDLTNAPATWVNQGTATIDTSRGPIIVTNNGATSIAMRVKAVPATPYTITIRLRVRLAYGVGQIQLGWRDSASGKLTAVALLGNGTLEIQKWNGPTSFNATYTTSTAWFDTFPSRQEIWLRIKDDGSTRYYQVSVDDGVTWENLHSVGRTDFLTADQVYFGVDNESAVSPYSVLTLYSWKES